ncbi:butyrophilin-like protein 3 isoform X2 [Chelmon rostratus]|uniref:butyrophilin-like protein 3 isoform X2 n=1 Tax=Chelmon rostratus TaxID=109905 RepID=UPI001BE78603|nr:butyrophilin-like protein 3 isoform X2 [Chelmon rostratus]
MTDFFALDCGIMGSLAVRVCLVVALGASMCGAAPISDNFVVVVKSNVSVHRGQTATLPCWLIPPQSAESLEVHWYHEFDSLIMLYREKKFEYGSQEASYAGRLSFGLKDAASGGLAAGDVSLQLVNATLEDAGVYTCYVSSDRGHDKAYVSLIVTETGSPLLLSAVWKEENMVNVSCESEGWFPKPRLRWSNQSQALAPKRLNFSKGSSGLWSVHSWLLVSSSSEVSCSVGLSDEEAKEARVHLPPSPPQPGKQVSGSSSAGWLAFALLLIATLAALGWLYFRKRVKKSKAEPDHAAEDEKLLPKEVSQPNDLSTAKEHYVNVKLEDAGNPYLAIKDHKIRDANCTFPDGQQVTCLTAIKGTPGFSSGQHYWEVSMGNIQIGLKQSWWAGVTSAAVIPPKSDLTPTASNGFWFLSSSSDRADRFQFSTEPRVSLPVRSRPQTVGVHLNYDSGELSFYDVEDKSLIGSLTATFTGEVFPFFNPGKGDKAPMGILQHRTEQGQCSDRETSVDLTA